MTLKALRPKGFRGPLLTLGDHIKARRLALDLHQREAAEMLNVSPATLLHWEKGQTEPPVQAMPAICRFLGYSPFPDGQTVSERLLQKRREMGWAIRDAARCLGVDPGSWRDWETGKTILYRKHRSAIARLIGLDERELSELMHEGER